MKKGKTEKKSKRSERRPKRGKPWEIREMALSPLDYETELAERQCGSRRTTKKDGGSDEDAKRSADPRKQMDGGCPKKVEAAKRGGQN